MYAHIHSVSYLSSTMLLKFPLALTSSTISTSAVSPPTLKNQRSLFPTNTMPMYSLLDYKCEIDSNKLQETLLTASQLIETLSKINKQRILRNVLLTTHCVAYLE